MAESHLPNREVQVGAGNPVLFHPEEYRVLSSDELDLLEAAYQHAVDALRRNITRSGFSACSLTDNQVYGTDANYRSVWARDGCKTLIWSLDLHDGDIRECQRKTLETLISHQGPTGQIPANVAIDSNRPDYSGVGGITSIDSALWLIIAMRHFFFATGDWAFAEKVLPRLQKAMDWLAAHDSNNCGLIEIPEAGDWTDLFARSYHVLYDEVLWFSALRAFAEVLQHLGRHQEAARYETMRDIARRKILRNFWPSTNFLNEDAVPSFADVQFRLGDTRYLVAEISPFGFSWRCDVYGNVLAFLTGLVDKERAMQTFRFLWGVGVNTPGPVKCLYPPVQAGDREWKDYFTVNLLNLPNHYHNGGIWPFIGALWVRFLHKLGLNDIARRELVHLAELCHLGAATEWEFNEWHHGETGRPMGKAYQAWSAAGFIRACHVLRLDPHHLGDHV